MHALLNAIYELTNHVNGTGLPLSEDAIDERKHTFSVNVALLETTYELMEAVLDLIDAYESYHDPLFINSKTSGGFYRNPQSPSDGLQLERAMIAIQQGALDQIYHGTLKDFMEGSRLFDSVVGPCVTSSILTGRKWGTASFFPGYVGPPDDQVQHNIEINATMPPCWGRPVTFCTLPSIRATGLYLSPGQIAAVMVPSSMIGADFKIQVGAHTVDNQSKDYHKRMDRITTTFDVKDTTTYVANPLGGALYLRVPYLSDIGVVTLAITGGVVQAPIFSKTSLYTTTERYWNDVLREAPGPWADFQTDKFLLQVPRIWMYKLDFMHMDSLMTDYDLAMDGVSELCGYPPDRQNNYVLYVNPDLHIKHGAYGIGYPQVNEYVSASANGPAPIGPVGASTH
jgi:hypothetical protein